VSYFTGRYTFLLASLVLIAVLLVIAHFASKLLTKHPYERKVYNYSFAITNYAYLGYVLIEAVFGESVLADFMFFAIPFIIYTYTVGYALLTGGKNPLVRLINPITVAILLGMVFGMLEINIPDTVSTVITMASSCVGPLSMLLVGITLSTFSFGELVKNRTAYVFCALRLAVIPAAAYLVCRVLHLDEIMPMVIMITCMPCGLNTIVFPKLIGEDCKTGARLALISHLFSVVTLPIWLSLIQ